MVTNAYSSLVLILSLHYMLELVNEQTIYYFGKGAPKPLQIQMIEEAAEHILRMNLSLDFYIWYLGVGALLHKFHCFQAFAVF